MDLDKRLVEAWVQPYHLMKSDPMTSGTGSYFTRELERILEETGDLICEAILLSLEKAHSYDLKGRAIVISRLSEMNLEGASCVQVFFLYRVWFELSLRLKRIVEAKTILSKLHGLVETGLPAPLKAEVYVCQGLLLHLKEAKVCFKKALSMIQRGTHQYKRNVINLPFAFAVRGELLDFGSYEVDDEFKNLEFYNTFVNGIVNNQAEVIEKYKDIKFDLKDRLEVELSRNIKLMNSVVGLYQGKSLGADNPESLSVLSLHNGDIQQALKHSLDVDLHMPIAQTYEFYLYSKVRVELSARNVNAADLIISRWGESIHNMYLADFFKARLELLKGHPDVALEYIAKLVKAVDKYDAKGRLDYELDLSLELKPSQVRFLFEGVGKRLQKKKPSLATLEVKELRGAEQVIGECESIKRVQSDIVRFADLGIPILIIGETGVGKDVVANALHQASSRKDEPFLAINCSAIAESLLVSELFGYQAGAYTGAYKNHKGILEEAGEGTVFMDEIGDISSALQVALLRVLESGEYRPVGSAKPRKIKCQLIAATNVPLASVVEKGSFRKDLYYRLKRLVIELPALRKRGDDLFLLTEYFLNRGKVEDEKARFSEALKKAMRRHEWLGNVRELKNEIEKMRLLNSDKLSYELKDADFLKQVHDVASSGSVAKAEEAALDGARRGGANNETNDHQGLPQKEKATLESILQNNTNILRRVDMIKDLFLKHKRFTRKEVAQMMGCHDRTVGRDIKKLIEEDFLEKVEPTKSPRTHYFILKE